MKVLVIGLGYVGLPICVSASLAGFEVQGFDKNKGLIDELNTGKSPVETVSDDEIIQAIKNGMKLSFKESEIIEFDVAIICVPTPLSVQKLPDLTMLKEAGLLLKNKLRYGNLVILESTSYPGTTEEFLLPILNQSNLVGGKDFYLSFSPERIDPGNSKYNLRNTPKIIAGLDKKSLDLSIKFYEKIVNEIIIADSIINAETAKLLENTYRYINIALINEMSMLCRDLEIDIWNVIELASTKPFGFSAFYPSVGVGGHCIPIDPKYLNFAINQKIGYPIELIEVSEKINSKMPYYIFQRIESIIRDKFLTKKQVNILLLGITYKPDVSDIRESASIELFKILLHENYRVQYHDPHVSFIVVDHVRYDSVPLNNLSNWDLIVLVQAHKIFDLKDIFSNSKILFDLTGKTKSYNKFIL